MTCPVWYWWVGWDITWGFVAAMLFFGAAALTYGAVVTLYRWRTIRDRWLSE